MSVHSFDTMARLRAIQLRVLNNQPVTPAEYRELLNNLRQDREVSSAKASTRAAAKAKAQPLDSGSLLDQLQKVL